MTPYGNGKPRGDVKTVQRMQFHRSARKGEAAKGRREAEEGAGLLDEQQS